MSREVSVLCSSSVPPAGSSSSVVFSLSDSEQSAGTKSLLPLEVPLTDRLCGRFILTLPWTRAANRRDAVMSSDWYRVKKKKKKEKIRLSSLILPSKHITEHTSCLQNKGIFKTKSQ